MMPFDTISRIAAQLIGRSPYCAYLIKQVQRHWSQERSLSNLYCLINDTDTKQKLGTSISNTLYFIIIKLLCFGAK